MNEETKTEPCWPYVSEEAARTEYIALREETIESQKQRVNLLTATLGLVGALFAYLVKDGRLPLSQAFVLILATVPGAVYSYSTRVRERRIADFLATFQSCVAVWNAALRGTDVRLKWYQRTSTGIIAGLIALDLGVILVSYELNPESFTLLLLIATIGVIVINFILFLCTANLPHFTAQFTSIKKGIWPPQ